MYSVVFTVVVLFAPTDVGQDLSPRLRDVIASRRADTSQIEWTVTWHGGRDDGLVERFRTRTAGDNVLETNFGDAHGFHPVAYRRSPPPDLSADELEEFEVPREDNAGTRHSLYDARVWHIERAERPLHATLQAGDGAQAFHPFNFAAAGLAPEWSSGIGTAVLGVRQNLLEGFHSAEWGEHREGHYDIITAEFNGRRLEWSLDTWQGGQPVHASFHVWDRLVNRSETDLKKDGQRWVPTAIRFFRGEDSMPYKTIDVQQASFNESWHARDLTPSDMGLLFGTQITTDDGEKYWTGTELLTSAEYDELIQIHGVPQDPKIVEMLAEGWTTPGQLLALQQRSWKRVRDEYYAKHGAAPWLLLESPEKDEWDVFVEKFIEKHALTGKRVELAREILARAKKLRDVYIRKHIAEIRKAERSGDPKKLAMYDAHTKRVFDHVLVRYLERLVPRKDEKSTP